MVEVLIASALIFGVLAGWIWVQQLYDRFVQRYPELGPFRQEGDGCSSGGCSCGGGHCTRGSPGQHRH